MDRRPVEKPVALGQAQKTRRLHKGILAQPLDRLDLLAGGKFPPLFPIPDDILRHPSIDTGDVLQQRGRGGVQIDADTVDARFHHLIEGFGQTDLIDIMLVKPYPD